MGCNCGKRKVKAQAPSPPPDSQVASAEPKGVPATWPPVDKPAE